MVLILFLIPIGLIIYIYERKVFKENHEILEGYIKIKISDNNTLSNSEKIAKTEELLNRNSYKIVQKDENHIVGEKKIFSIGLLFIGMVVLYIPYLYFFQKPDTLSYEIS